MRPEIRDFWLVVLADIIIWAFIFYRLATFNVTRP